MGSVTISSCYYFQQYWTVQSLNERCSQKLDGLVQNWTFQSENELVSHKLNGTVSYSQVLWRKSNASESLRINERTAANTVVAWHSEKRS